MQQASHGGLPCAGLGVASERLPALAGKVHGPITFLFFGRSAPNLTGVVHGSMRYRLQTLRRIRQLSSFRPLEPGEGAAERSQARHGACLGKASAAACPALAGRILSPKNFFIIGPICTKLDRRGTHGSMRYRLQSLRLIRRLLIFWPLEPGGKAACSQPRPAAVCLPRRDQGEGCLALSHSPKNFFVLKPILTKLHGRGTWVHGVPPAKFGANPTTFKFSSTGAPGRRRGSWPASTGLASARPAPRRTCPGRENT